VKLYKFCGRRIKIKKKRIIRYISENKNISKDLVFIYFRTEHILFILDTSKENNKFTELILRRSKRLRIELEEAMPIKIEYEILDCTMWDYNNFVEINTIINHMPKLYYSAEIEITTINYIVNTFFININRVKY